ncbi:MAG: lipoyl(octanoyl) transferase LipB [Candidatus Brocadiia bacterium]
MPTCHVVRLDRIGYRAALDLQLRIVARMKAAEPRDAVLLLLEHPPVVTMGRSGEAANLRLPPRALAARGVEFHHTTRGGDVTYHGPGQIVGYPILRLPEERRDVRRYLRSLEAVLIAALARFGIAARREPGLTGVWTERGKVAAIGVAFTRWVAYHGFALNVAPEMRHFGLIVPCGIDDRPVTSLEQLLGHAPPRREVEDALVEAFVQEFGYAEAREHAFVSRLSQELGGDPA